MENSSSRFLISYIRKEYICVSGKKVAPFQVGYESYGTLAPTTDNISLICHYYSSTSHAAGKYSAEDRRQGTGMPSSGRAGLSSTEERSPRKGRPMPLC
jgi:homoserine acetyltransferase